ncbi:MAG: hypothetical protein AB7R69_00725 [Candidatus Babeliales bacterium]
MFGDFNFLSKEFRGVITMLFGIVLLLHTLNILQQWLNWILIFFSLAMIFYGFFEAQLWRKIRKTVEEKTNIK